MNRGMMCYRRMLLLRTQGTVANGICVLRRQMETTNPPSWSRLVELKRAWLYSAGATQDVVVHGLDMRLRSMRHHLLQVILAGQIVWYGDRIQHR